jgi:hypothetical protein
MASVDLRAAEIFVAGIPPHSSPSATSGRSAGARRSVLPRLLAVLALVAGAGATRGQLLEHGPEFEVNSYTLSGYHRAKSIPFDAAGGFWVVWGSSDSPGGDTDGTSVQARRFDAAGAALEPQFQVNSYTTGFQSGPRGLALANGDFLVVWSGASAAEPDDGIVARRFASDGLPLSGEMQSTLHDGRTVFRRRRDRRRRRVRRRRESVLDGTDSVEGASSTTASPSVNFQINPTTTGLKPSREWTAGPTPVRRRLEGERPRQRSVRARRFAADGAARAIFVGTVPFRNAYGPPSG